MKHFFVVLFWLFSLYSFGQGAGECHKTTDPGAFAPSVDDCWTWINTVSGVHFCYDGTTWSACSTGGGSDGNDFVTSHAITSGASGDPTRTLESTVPNQTNPTIVFNVEDGDADDTNELQAVQKGTLGNGNVSYGLTLSGVFHEWVGENGIEVIDGSGNLLTWRIDPDSLDAWGANGMFDFFNQNENWEVSVFGTRPGEPTKMTLNQLFEYDYNGNRFQHDIGDNAFGILEEWNIGDVSNEIVGYLELGDSEDFKQRWATNYDLGIKSKDGNIPGSTESTLLRMGNISEPYVELGESGSQTRLIERHFSIDLTPNLPLDKSKDIHHVTSGGSVTLMAPSDLFNSSSYNDESIVITIKNAQSGNLTVNPNGSETIDGNANYTMSGFESIDIYTDGTNYFIR